MPEDLTRAAESPERRERLTWLLRLILAPATILQSKHLLDHHESPAASTLLLVALVVLLFNAKSARVFRVLSVLWVLVVYTSARFMPYDAFPVQPWALLLVLLSICVASDQLAKPSLASRLVAGWTLPVLIISVPLVFSGWQYKEVGLAYVALILLAGVRWAYMTIWLGLVVYAITFLLSDGLMVPAGFVWDLVGPVFLLPAVILRGVVPEVTVHRSRRPVASSVGRR